MDKTRFDRFAHLEPRATHAVRDVLLATLKRLTPRQQAHRTLMFYAYLAWSSCSVLSAYSLVVIGVGASHALLVVTACLWVVVLLPALLQALHETAKPNGEAHG